MTYFVVDDVPFTDTHVHFHDFSHPSLRWDWLRPAAEHPELGDFGSIKSHRYLPDDFIGETRFQPATRVIHVQSAIGSPDPVEESAWLQSHHERIGLPTGIVGFADLSRPDVREVLRRHSAFAAVCGIRDLRYDDYLTNPAWLAGLAEVEQCDFVFCDDPEVSEMPRLAAIAQQHPKLRICIDHAGYPRRRDRDYFLAWRHGMSALAAQANTVIKISGLGMCDHRWTVDSLRPWVAACIELWGTDRVVFGTNWPVDRLFSSYGDVVRAYLELTEQYSSNDRLKMFHTNAGRIFKLHDSSTGVERNHGQGEVGSA
jgi:predicted TIM-barrel fold metal-dependent hydrolase